MDWVAPFECLIRKPSKTSETVDPNECGNELSSCDVVDVAMKVYKVCCLFFPPKCRRLSRTPSKTQHLIAAEL